MKLNNMFAENNVRYLYKYLPYSKGSLEVLKSETLKYTCPLEFNDPFDCSPAYNEEVIDQLLDNRKDLVDEIAKREGWHPDDYENKVKEKSSILEENFEEINKDTLKTIGIVSLSRNPKNILTWSHYAKNHTGFVVGFRIPKKYSRIDMQQIATFFVTSQ
jgi:hypothetical protein